MWYVAVDRHTSEILGAGAIGPSLFVSADGSTHTRTMYDLIGNSIGVTDALADAIIRLADHEGWELTTWLPLDRPSRIQYAINKGFVQVSVLLRRAPVRPEEEAV